MPAAQAPVTTPACHRRRLWVSARWRTTRPVFALPLPPHCSGVFAEAGSSGTGPLLRTLSGDPVDFGTEKTKTRNTETVLGLLLDIGLNTDRYQGSGRVQ